MTIRPDPTFHASPKLVMQAPVETFAYTLPLSPDFSRPDALAVIDVDPQSKEYGKENPVLKPLETNECRDALLNSDGTESEWPGVDVIIGNPVFS